MVCLSENTLQVLMDGALPDGRMADVQLHLDACRACRELCAELARQRSAPANTGGNGDPVNEPDEPCMIAPGAHVGRFVIRATLGVGGMGVVYAAEDPLLGRSVALKLIRAAHHQGPGSEEWRARLFREARAVARLAHPNVIAVHDIGVHRDELFVAMELVDGITLRSWLAARRRTWREVAAVFLEAGRGLRAAHDAGLVHRDFKPDNVLIGRDGRVRVTDFGLARLLDAEHRGDAGDVVAPGSSSALGSGAPHRSARLTRTGILIGTPGYIAPEVLRGGLADTASDQFSFCVALYEALCHAIPGDRESQVDAPTHDARIPRSLRELLRRGLDRNPASRWPEMQALLAQLERTAHGTRYTLLTRIILGIVGSTLATLFVIAMCFLLAYLMAGGHRQVRSRQQADENVSLNRDCRQSEVVALPAKSTAMHLGRAAVETSPGRRCAHFVPARQLERLVGDVEQLPRRPEGWILVQLVAIASTSVGVIVGGWTILMRHEQLQ